MHRPPNELARSNGGLHAVSLTIMLVAAAALAFLVWWSRHAAAGNGDRGPNLDDLEAIEASLADKKPSPKQPQKPKQAPPPEVKVEGVSHDEDKKPDEQKKDEPVKKPEKTVEDEYKKYQRTNTDDEDADFGKPTEPDIGAFDGSEFGFASETKGDPYFQALVADLLKGWEFPELLSDVGEPVECLRLDASGKITDTLFKIKSGNAELDDSVEHQVKELVKQRDEDPRPVPDHLLKQTMRWICIKFAV
jgi:type IV secretory pathway VirB10-like protein